MYTTFLAAATLAATVSATFNAAAKTNVITYWGQGANQDRLLTTCQNPSYDIINIGFVNVFPDQGAGGWPGTNFGNACWGDVYEHKGVNTSLLKTCPNIGPDVIACQQTYGKKIFLSIGGGEPTNYYIKSDKSGKSFANFLWAAFGPASAAKANVPRPWGDAGVDGFDFDIENLMDPVPQSNYQTSGYAAMITQFKNVLFPKDTSKSYYISGAPQCTIPDSHLSAVLSSAWFDFFTIQFYNTPTCSARAAIQKAKGTGTNDISYKTWTSQTSKNPNVKMSIGLPGSTTAAIDTSYYLTPAEAQSLVTRFYGNAKFGGIMVWEATAAQKNTPCSVDYGTWMKKVLTAKAAGTTLDTNIKTCAGVSKKRSIHAPHGHKHVHFAAEKAAKRAKDSESITTTYTSVSTGSIRTTISGRLYTGEFEETTVITTTYAATDAPSAAPKQTHISPSPSPDYAAPSSSLPAPPPATSYPAPPPTSTAEASASPESVTVYASSPTSGTPTHAHYTSYNVITVIPVPMSSGAVSYSASGNAAAQGTSSGAPYASASGSPIPATGAASSRRLSVAGLLCGIVAALFT
jgi:chitinase